MSDAIVKDLLWLSHELGKPENAMAILGEGNTSARLDDGTFYVKGSGSQLMTLQEKQLSRARFDDVLGMLDEPDMDETTIDQRLKASLTDPAMVKPSIETMLHALCLTEGGAKFAGHTHAEAVNQVLCSKLGPEPFMRHIFPDAIVVCGRVPMVVPYVDPGMPLAIAFRDALKAYLDAHGKPPKLALMLNHGILALGQTAKDVLNTSLMAQKWARILVGSLQLGGATYLSEASADAIDGRQDEHYRRKMLSGE